VEGLRRFGDSVLDDLMTHAIKRNDQIQIAATRLAQARALVRGTQADKAPQVDVAAGAFRGTQPQTGTRAITNLSAGANLSYEVDLFGRLARATDAAQFDAQSREALLRGAQLLVQADVAQTYFALRALDIEALAGVNYLDTHAPAKVIVVSHSTVLTHPTPSRHRACESECPKACVS
jgi:outer membrane protein, multidrug efflux system